MIPNRLIRREMQKKKKLVAAENGGEWRRRCSRRRFLCKIPKLGVIIDSIKKILPNYLSLN